MIRTLLIIAGAALVLSLATLAGAVAVGGRDMARHGWQWTFHDRDGDTVSFERSDGTEPAETTRTLAWTGGESLIVEMSADVEYVQGETAGVTITGAPGLVDRVRLEGGRLTMTGEGERHDERIVIGRHRDGAGLWIGSDEVRVVVTAPAVNRFEMAGSGDLSIRQYDQDALTIDLTGSGEITAEGRTRSLTLDIPGSGDADLESLMTTDAQVEISGSGDARLAPTGAATISISGSGDASLATRPATLRQNLTGSGDVRQD